jgi:hypothetical protein
MHTHAPDTEVHPNCELCQSHGPVFGTAFEVEEVPLEARLRTLIDQAGQEPTSDDETVDPSAAPAKSDGNPFQEEEFSDAEFPAEE